MGGGGCKTKVITHYYWKKKNGNKTLFFCSPPPPLLSRPVITALPFVLHSDLFKSSVMPCYLFGVHPFRSSVVRAVFFFSVGVHPSGNIYDYYPIYMPSDILHK